MHVNVDCIYYIINIYIYVYVYVCAYSILYTVIYTHTHCRESEELFYLAVQASI